MPLLGVSDRKHYHSRNFYHDFWIFKKRTNFSLHTSIQFFRATNFRKMRRRAFFIFFYIFLCIYIYNVYRCLYMYMTPELTGNQNRSTMMPFNPNSPLSLCEVRLSLFIFLYGKQRINALMRRATCMYELVLSCFFTSVLYLDCTSLVNSL